MGFRYLETPLLRLQQSRYLRLPAGRLRVIRAIHLLKNHLSDFIRDAFMPRMQKMSSQGLSTPWNIVSSTSLKYFFKTSRRQGMSSHGHSPA
jgi:hypothetical protein